LLLAVAATTLGIVAAITLGDDGSGVGQRTPKLRAPAKATVKVVWFRGPPGPDAGGGTSPTTVSITPNDEEGARVGIVEEFAGGTGPQWKAAAWLAAFRSAQTTGQNLIDYEFLVGTGGQIDGPSAGMLITATMVAMLRGKTPRADTTMTGTINPDGSAGPVGGIVQKMDGASKDGIKRFGFPMGARTHLDLRDGKTVDLLDAAKEFGLEAREIRDVFEAYEFLTGDRLERPVPVAENEMELDADTAMRLRSKNEKWKARVKTENANIAAAARGLGPAGAPLQPIAQQADAFSKRASQFERNDFLAAAYDSYVQSAIFATITKERARFLQARDEVDDLVAQVEAAAAVQDQLAALSSEVDLQARVTTGGGQINALRAFQALVTAECYATLGAATFESASDLLAQRQRRKLTATELKELKQRLEQPILFFSIARTLLDVAADQRDFGTEEGQSPPVAAEVIARSAAAYGSAAGAVLAYLASLTGEQATNGDDDYLVAVRAKNRVEAMALGRQGSDLLRLAAGSLAFLKGASLVNKYYSLGCELDAGALTVTNRKALSLQLDLAKQLAREAAQTAKARVGFVPVAARLAYQLGVARRDSEGDDKQKIAALEAFWESAFWSELVANAPPAHR
ncbi:MAG: S16 family serine protease, partial [Planctomycetota bacterium]